MTRTLVDMPPDGASIVERWLSYPPELRGMVIDGLARRAEEHLRSAADLAANDRIPEIAALRERQKLAASAWADAISMLRIVGLPNAADEIRKESKR